MRHYFPVLLTIILGLSLSIFSAIFAHKIDDHYAYSHFESTAKEQVWLIEYEINHTLSILQAFANFYTLQETAQSQNFAVFAKPLLLQQPFLSSINWVPRVTTREQYFPIEQQASSKTSLTQYIVPGFDFGSKTTFLTALTKARDTNTAQISVDTHQTIAIFYPIYPQAITIDTVEKRRYFLTGFIVATLQLDDLINKILQNYHAKYHKSMNIIIQDNTISQQILYTNYLENENNISMILLNLPIKVMDKTWSITYFADKNDYLQYNNWIAINVFLLIVLITALTAIYFFKSIRYIDSLQSEIAKSHLNLTQEVARQTIALTQQNQVLQQQIAQYKAQELVEKHDLLKELHERFTSVLDGLNSAIYVIDMQNYKILFANRYVRENLYKPYILGNVCWQILQSKQTEPCNFCTNERLLDPSGQPTGVYSWEYQHNQRWFYMQDQAIRWNDGAWVRLSVGTEITERKQAEIAIKRSEARLREIQRIAKIGYWEWDYQHDCVTGSEEFFEQFNLSVRENGKLPIEHFLNIIHPDDRPHIEQKIKSSIDTHHYYRTEFRVVHSKNVIRYLQAFGSVTYDESGSPIYFIGSTQDITERKQAEIALQQSKKFLQDIIDNTNILVFVKDLEGRYILTNRCHNEILRRSREDVLGKTDYHIHSEEVADQIITDDSYVFGFEKSLTREESLELHSDKYTFITSKIPLFDESGQVYAVCSVAMDISERKKIEEILKKRENKLRLAKEAAEAASRAKSTFLANMSHELRTPLNGILGYAQLFNRDVTLNKQQQEGMQIIQRCGEHLLILINDILDLSKIEAGKLELMPKEFRFTDFLKDIVDLFKMRATQKGIHFSCEQIPPATSVQSDDQKRFPDLICADEKRLRQVLLNLVSNAIKFTDKGGVSFKVIYHDNYIRFDVEDSGCGIATEELENIFKPFQQVGSKMMQIEGTGLGLPISRKLVKLMGGTLQVESLVGVGSLFWFEIPLDVVQYIDKSLVSLKQKNIIGFKGQSRKILLIDDHIENIKLLVNLLTPLSFQVKSCQTGEEGLKIANVWHPDAILIDLVMPHMDGFEFTRRFRTLENTQKTVVIAVSASAFDVHQTKSLIVGCDSFIAKPIHIAELLEALQKHLGLEWIYQVEKPILSQPVDNNINLSTIKLPTPTQSQHLLEVIMLGDIQAIQAELDILLQRDITLQPFIDHAQKLASQFKTKQLSELIKQINSA